MRKFLKLLLVMLSTIIISGCGFHLRGYEPLPTELKVLHLETASPYSDFIKQLRQYFTSAKVTLVEATAAAPITLRILNDGTSQQLTSSGASGQTNTYNLTYTVNFQLLDNHGSPIQSPQTVSASRSYSVTSNQLLGDTSVQNTLITQMQRDVIFQLLNRMRSPQTLKQIKARLDSAE